jgi:hypothetical protein
MAAQAGASMDHKLQLLPSGKSAGQAERADAFDL